MKCVEDTLLWIVCMLYAQVCMYVGERWRKKIVHKIILYHKRERDKRERFVFSCIWKALITIITVERYLMSSILSLWSFLSSCIIPEHNRIIACIYLFSHSQEQFSTCPGFLHTDCIWAVGSWIWCIDVYRHWFICSSYLWCFQHCLRDKCMEMCIWPMYMSDITLEFEYMNQRFAINGAIFSPKNIFVIVFVIIVI